MEPKSYWLISAPKTREDTFNTLNNRTNVDEPLSVKNYKFAVPDLKVGTLDSLMSLSDELHKSDTLVENVTRKIAQQLLELLDTGNKNEKIEPLSVNNNSAETFLTFFRWEEAKYPTSTPLKNLVEQIQTQVVKLDEELKIKSSEYNNLCHALSGEERKQGGNLLVKDLGDVIQKKHLIEDSEFMEALVVVIPKTNAKQWLAEYERLADFVVPRSAEFITEDNEYQLYRVIVFKKVTDQFKQNARDKKYIVRDYSFDPNKSVKEDKKKLEADKDKLKKNLIRWCRTNFAEAFTAWIHLKAIRVFVESVLRYGLPVNFQAMLLLPQKNKVKHLRKALNDLYSELTSKSVFGKSGDDNEDDETFFPYVFLEVNLDFRKQ
eukprot:TRINITY_DN419_c0_g1_i1.p1 TRINITY_DN419_c0_g1~~TRINITY_DN419_c0_g1_i1.p1  ORF type:complete len:377 (-),score=122.09 TRINITY_DN419_c0_g1_i1:67-1197(-)